MTPFAGAQPTGSQDGLDLVLLAAGLLLCFLGIRSVQLAAACAGFGLGAELVAAAGGDLLLGVLVGLAAAAGGVVLVRLAIRFGAFAVGALAGGLVAVSVYRTLPSGVSLPLFWVVGIVLVVALVCGVAMRSKRGPAAQAVTALAGAALVVRAVVEGGPAFFGFLRDPAGVVGSVVALVVLLALAWAGVTVQRGRVS